MPLTRDIIVTEEFSTKPTPSICVGIGCAFCSWIFALTFILLFLFTAEISLGIFGVVLVIVGILIVRWYVGKT